MTISMTISKTVFNNFVTTTCICLQLATGTILLAGVHNANARGGGSNRGASGDISRKPASYVIASMQSIGRPIAAFKATAGGDGRSPIGNDDASLKQN